MEESTKDHSEIEIKPSQPTFHSEFTDDAVEEQRFPFFKSSSRKKQDTWIISVFVILHLVAFFVTMFANNCWLYSHGQCALQPLGRLSFQPLSENPLLGPSASTLDEMGAFRQTFLTNQHQTWRIFTCVWLHAGAIHLVFNLCSVIFIGIHLEQEYGPLRIGIIYILSAFSGCLMAALFLINRPAVVSSGAMFGLLGAMLSSLIRNWKLYTNKFAGLVAVFCICTINFGLGLLPYINNFANIGGLTSGILLGFVLLFSPQLKKVAQTKGSLFDHDIKRSINLKKKLDKPVLRSVSLVLFILLFCGGLVAFLHGINVNKYCSWCQYIDCIPSKWWSCSDKVMQHCETMASGGRLTLTCTSNDNFRVFPFTNLTQARIDDLCSLICSFGFGL